MKLLSVKDEERISLLNFPHRLKVSQYRMLGTDVGKFLPNWMGFGQPVKVLRDSDVGKTFTHMSDYNNPKWECWS